MKLTIEIEIPPELLVVEGNRWLRKILDQLRESLPKGWKVRHRVYLDGVSSQNEGKPYRSTRLH